VEEGTALYFFYGRLPSLAGTPLLLRLHCRTSCEGYDPCHTCPAHLPVRSRLQTLVNAAFPIFGRLMGGPFVADYLWDLTRHALSLSPALAAALGTVVAAAAAASVDGIVNQADLRESSVQLTLHDALACARRAANWTVVQASASTYSSLVQVEGCLQERCTLVRGEWRYSAAA